MPSPTTTATRERARPLLGTIVRIRVSACDGADAAIDEAFAEIATIHARMSFQEADSDLSAIGRARAGEVVRVHERTRDCLRIALGWSARSDGAFDPVAAAGSDATWQDLSVDDDGIRIRRALRIDLSGIAKGFAVDRACAMLAAHHGDRAVVEAGGDLRVMGAAEEGIALRPSFAVEPALVELRDGALASSDPALARSQGDAVHIDGRDRRRAPNHFIAVAAPRCADADALTKVVLALGDESHPLLVDAGAIAWRHDGVRWSTLGGAA